MRVCWVCCGPRPARSGPDRDGQGDRSAVCASRRYLASGAEPGLGAVNRGGRRQPAAGARVRIEPHQTRSAAGYSGCATASRAAAVRRRSRPGRSAIRTAVRRRRSSSGGRGVVGPPPGPRSGPPGHAGVRVRRPTCFTTGSGRWWILPTPRWCGRYGWRATRRVVVSQSLLNAVPGGAADHGATDSRGGRQGGRAARIFRSAACCASPAAMVTSITSC